MPIKSKFLLVVLSCFLYLELNFASADANQDKIESTKGRKSRLWRSRPAITRHNRADSSTRHTLKAQIQNLQNQINRINTEILLTGKKN